MKSPAYDFARDSSHCAALLGVSVRFLIKFSKCGNDKLGQISFPVRSFSLGEISAIFLGDFSLRKLLVREISWEARNCESGIRNLSWISFQKLPQIISESLMYLGRENPVTFESKSFDLAEESPLKSVSAKKQVDLLGRDVSKCLKPSPQLSMTSKLKAQAAQRRMPSFWIPWRFPRWLMRKQQTLTIWMREKCMRAAVKICSYWLTSLISLGKRANIVLAKSSSHH